MYKTDLKALSRTKCTICGSYSLEHICSSRCQRIPFLVTPVSICRDCGFVLVNPRWTASQYSEIMDLWYPTKFTLDPPGDPSTDKRYAKWRTMWRRILSFYPNGIRNILDLGAGQGWCIEFLMNHFPDMKSYAVERWQPCREYMKKQYDTVMVGSEIETGWSINPGIGFDLVVLRHTLEHLLEPLQTLQRIRSVLSPDGLAYIVVPSLRHPTRLLIHSFFRPVHLSYFVKETFVSLTNAAGLEPVVIEEGNNQEMWGLFKAGTPSHSIPDVYHSSVSLTKRYKRKEMYKSFVECLHIRALNFADMFHLRVPYWER